MTETGRYKGQATRMALSFPLQDKIGLPPPRWWLHRSSPKRHRCGWSRRRAFACIFL